MKTIPLTHNQTALIDDCDFERVSAHSWYAYHAYKQARGKRTQVSRPSTDAVTPVCWYAGATIGGDNISLHRFILGDRPGLEIDHRDNNGLHNCRSNLRHVTHQQNCRNSLGKVRNRKSRFKGVSWTSAPRRKAKPWRANIHAHNKQRSLGYFATEEEAAFVYNMAASWLWGEHAKLNRWDAEPCSFG